MIMDEDQLSVHRDTSLNAGGCLGCSRHILLNARGQKKHAVWVIKLGTSSVRVCRKCRDKLIKELK